MPRSKVIEQEDSQPLRPALTPEARENQLIALSVDLAEKQLRNGTASSQVITHFLKLACEKERLQNKLLEEQIELAKAKTENIKYQQEHEESFAEAIKAFKTYNGVDEDEEIPID